jgi:hypothetical protein
VIAGARYGLSHARMFRVALLITCCLAFTSGAANACDGPRDVRDATFASIKAFIHTKQMVVLTFGGYSGAQYEAPEALLEHASHVLDRHDSARTLINIGATAEGIGAVYEIAKKGLHNNGHRLHSCPRRARCPLQVRRLCVLCQRPYLGRAGSRNQPSLAHLGSDS